MKVICKLQHASELINGVAFKKHGEVMLSEDVSEEVANDFASIPGYEILPDTRANDKGQTTNPTADELAAAEAAKAASDKEAAEKKEAKAAATEKATKAAAEKAAKAASDKA